MGKECYYENLNTLRYSKNQKLIYRKGEMKQKADLGWKKNYKHPHTNSENTQNNSLISRTEEKNM
jgi:hypothetical protein